MAVINDAFLGLLDAFSDAVGLTKREIGGALLPKISGIDMLTLSLSDNVSPGKFSLIPILDASIPLKMVPLISEIHHYLWCGRGYF